VDIVVNMFVALCVGVSYVMGYLLAVLSLLFLITWIIDDKLKTNWSSKLFGLCNQYWSKSYEKAICQKCEGLNHMDIDIIEDKYCSQCGKELKKTKTSAYDLKVEKMTQKILLFALAAGVMYSISFALFVIFVIISIVAYCFYCAAGSSAPKEEDELAVR